MGWTVFHWQDDGSFLTGQWSRQSPGRDAPHSVAGRDADQNGNHFLTYSITTTSSVTVPIDIQKAYYSLPTYYCLQKAEAYKNSRVAGP